MNFEPGILGCSSPIFVGVEDAGPLLGKMDPPEPPQTFIIFVILRTWGAALRSSG
jgi:hypothetical protein